MYFILMKNRDRVVFEGYKDEEEERFRELFQEWLAANKNNVKK